MTARLSSCEVMDEGAAQRDCEQLMGLELKHSVISVRPLVGALGRSRSNSSAANRSTALYLQGCRGLRQRSDLCTTASSYGRGADRCIYSYFSRYLNSEAGYVLLGRNKKIIWLKICKDACGIPMHDKAKTMD